MSCFYSLYKLVYILKYVSRESLSGVVCAVLYEACKVNNSTHAVLFLCGGVGGDHTMEGGARNMQRAPKNMCDISTYHLNDT